MDDIAETSPATPTQRLTAEAIGTAILVFVGCGAITLGQGEPALAFGIALAAVILAFGRVSGGHFNPAVSIGYAVGGRMSWSEAGGYIGAQLVGGIVGAFVLFLTLIGIDGYEKFDGVMGQNYYGDQAPEFSYAVWAALLLELVLTVVFVMVVMGVRDAREPNALVAPLVVGLAYSAVVYAGYAATGGSANPARSLGPALFSGGDGLTQVWPFIVAPAVGGLVAGLVYPAVFGRDADPVAGSGLSLSSGRSATPAPGYGGYPGQWGQPQTGGYETGGYASGSHEAGGYAGVPQAGQPAPQATSQPTPQVTPQVTPQPIIQDGWQWDPQAQQWIPAQQPPPGGWGAPQGDEQTQIRNPDGL